MPTKKPGSRADAYERRKARERDRQKQITADGNNIAARFPKCKDHKKRRRVARSLKAFCLECMADKFGLKFSPDHLKALAKMERAILEGGNFALAMPRGSGKTTLILAACLWAILNGYKRYLALMGADKKAAAKLLRALRVQLETNQTLLELYPEAVYPIRRLERKANRCKGQHYNGTSTYIEWTAETIVFATIPGAEISGAVIEVVGILGRVRGMQHETPDGRTLRPDLFVVDDPQTNKSARSGPMVEQRLEIISAVCPGLAGPGEDISGFCLCTVIEREDVADQLLDVEKYPDWQGERFQMVTAWPNGAAEDHWEQYGILWREGMAAGRGFSAATAYYKAHRRAMDRGFKVSWSERYKRGKELSAQQAAYNLLLKMRDAFWKECQNAPLGDEDDEDLLSVEQIQQKTHGHQRDVLPPGANLLTAFVDVQDKALYWLILAVRRSDFSAWVVNYGAWPEQRANYFTLSTVNKTLHKSYPRAGKEGRIRQGILDLVDHLVTRRFFMPDGTTELRIKRIGLDAAYESRAVQAAALESRHSAILLPRFGRGIRAEDAPFESWKPKPGETRGVGWKIRPAEGGGVYGLIDVNYWKNFVHSRFNVATGDPGSLSLFAPEKGRLTTHRMIAEHCRAERRIEDKTSERTVLIFKDKTNKPDNHLWDALVGACAMAGVEGAALRELRVSKPAGPARRRRRRTVVKV